MALTKFNYNSFDLTTAASKGLAFNSSANGFETSTGGSMILIKTLTASSSSTLSFVDGSSDVVLDNTYPVYMFKFINIHASTTTPSLKFNLSTDSGSNYNVTKTTTFFRAIHNEAGADGSIGYDAGFDLAQSTSDQAIMQYVGDGNDESASGSMILFNPSSNTFVKHFLATTNKTGVTYNGTNFIGGYGNTTSPIDAIIFRMDSGNIDSGTIKLYGIKDS